MNPYQYCCTNLTTSFLDTWCEGKFERLNDTCCSDVNAMSWAINITYNVSVRDRPDCGYVYRSGAFGRARTMRTAGWLVAVLLALQAYMAVLAVP
ncbi:hypothetical protein K437DRAFT_30478 [Tilletiaria anomala UBC 951]|uniref:Uncharacterized protein n=1 Tax=Tilletiaria anomala (strain ATCC 24038 / CBS 436.72 / UBC 951) TaxID=1037660 RepID=A0A066VHD4_TILAU|nr:uncharacterized protein K437DRAFT_30478 [Tilletiaria anomala UBC 951]KDN37985.1 hypothetical protein K437DRAFT_30478 [Tilletiaria anomala UBC 951]